jgi:hypothetical protein
MTPNSNPVYPFNRKGLKSKKFHDNNEETPNESLGNKTNDGTMISTSNHDLERRVHK